MWKPVEVQRPACFDEHASKYRPLGDVMPGEEVRARGVCVDALLPESPGKRAFSIPVGLGQQRRIDGSDNVVAQPREQLGDGGSAPFGDALDPLQP